MKGIHDNPGNVRALRSESFGEGLNAKGSSQASHDDLSGRSNPSVPLFSDDGEIDPVVKRPTQVHTGDVWQIPRVKLKVAEGPQQSSIVSATSGRLRLVTGTVFVLSVGQALQVAGTTRPSAAAPPPPQSRQAAIPLLPRCKAPDCTISSRPVASAGRTEWKLPLEQFGYRRSGSGEMPRLDYAAAVAFLGPDQLLLVFDPHALVKRSAGDRPEDSPHMAKGVLFDLASRRVIKKMDWRVGDGRQILWPLQDGRVVVHQGNSLRWYGSGLVQQKVLPLTGTLAFFRASPDVRHYAVGTFRELHNPKEHARLAEADASGPEEMVKVQLLDGDLNEIYAGEQSSLAYAPVLLDQGSVELRIFKGTQFYLKERMWDGTSSRSFARVSSSCIPRVGSMATDMVVMETCSSAMEHRVLVVREDGKPVLETHTRLEEFAPLATGSSGSEVFALSVLDGGDQYRRGAVFHAKDLTGETVSLYGAAEGRPLASITLEHPLPSHQTVAFSSDGTTLAVLDGEEIYGYSVASPTRTARENKADPSAGRAGVE